MVGQVLASVARLSATMFPATKFWKSAPCHSFSALSLSFHCVSSLPPRAVYLAVFSSMARYVRVSGVYLFFVSLTHECYDGHDDAASFCVCLSSFLPFPIVFDGCDRAGAVCDHF